MLRELARRLLWCAQDKAPRRFRLPEDFIPVDLNDAPVSLDDASPVTLAHPMELEAAKRDAWLLTSNDYELFQPFEQLTRQVCRLDPDTPQVRKDVPSVRDQPVAAGSILGLIPQGWEKLQDGAQIHAKARPITPVDTTGAGDTFVGVLANGLAEGLAIGQAMERACAAASLSCLTAGAQAGMPQREALEQHLAQA